LITVSTGAALRDTDLRAYEFYLVACMVAGSSGDRVGAMALAS
jgi:hypothetical protein